MKVTFKRSTLGSAFTLLELLLVVLIIAILAALLLPALEKARGRSRQIECLSQLKQIGLAHHAFAHDHQDAFPFQVPLKEGGTMELAQAAVTQPSVISLAFRHFQALSNELESSKLLHCPADSRNAAATFGELSNEQLSYLIAVSATYLKPDSVLAADRNLVGQDGAAPSILRLPGDFGGAEWTRDGHEYKGNVLFADGHVERTLRWTVFGHAGGVTAWLPVAFPAATPGPIAAAPSAGTPAPPPAPGAPGRGGGNQGGNSGFTIWQTYFQPPGSPAAATPPPDLASAAPPSTPAPGTRLPAEAAQPPAPPPMAAAAAPPKPATNPPANQNALVEAVPVQPNSIRATANASSAPPAPLFTVFIKPQRCWYCWLILVTLAVSAAVLLGFEVRRRRQQRAAAATAAATLAG